MSHRSLVAFHRRDGRYDCYDLPDGWGAAGEGRPSTGDGAGEVAGSGWFGGSSAGGPDVAPTARGVSFRSVLDRLLDPLLHESLVVVGQDGQVCSYLVLPYLIATAEGLHTDAPAGAAVSLVGTDGASISPDYVRGWHHGVTETLGEAIDRSLLSTAEAIEWLEDAVRRLAGGRHEVLDVPPSG